MGGPIGVNYLRGGADLVDIARKLRSRVSLAFEGAIFERALFDHIEMVVGRFWLEGQPGQGRPELQLWMGQPLWESADQCHAMGRALADTLVSMAPWTEWLQGYNERFHDQCPQDIDRFLALELGFTERLHELGRKSVVLNIPVGNVTSVLPFR